MCKYCLKINNNFITCRNIVFKHFQIYSRRHQNQTNTCGRESSFEERGFGGGHCADFQVSCCTSTSHGLHHLKENGILKEQPDGSHKIISSPNMLPFLIPPHLKHIAISKWETQDQIWLNA